MCPVPPPQFINQIFIPSPMEQRGRSGNKCPSHRNKGQQEERGLALLTENRREGEDLNMSLGEVYYRRDKKCSWND